MLFIKLALYTVLKAIWCFPLQERLQNGEPSLLNEMVNFLCCRFGNKLRRIFSRYSTELVDVVVFLVFLECGA